MANDDVRSTTEGGTNPNADSESATKGEHTTSAPPASDSKDGTNNTHSTGGKDNCPASPVAQPQQYHQAYLPHLTPQPGAGYYIYHQPQVTPEPPSPGGLYTSDVTSFLRQQAALNPFATYVSNIPQAPLSPTGRSMIPPPSPLFPRVANMEGLDPVNMNMSRVVPQSAISYMTSPQLGAMGAGFGPIYQGYGTNGYALNGDAAPDENLNGWSMSHQQAQNAGYPQASPQLQSAMYGRPTGNNRSQSFDEMLPPSMLEHQGQISSAYSPYATNQGTPVPTAGSPMFSHQAQTWGYGPSAAEMYGAPPSPLQPRHGGGYPSVMERLPYGAVPSPQLPFYPATSPGPPIQTTASNKGPDGANLFVFHIPNHFTNLDMYSLFCQYGNLLSVRIMVEKDTGRSRGFGFVSYDTPEAAAMAIKELNGFAIGNKRLKVQHKQIRANDQQRGFNDMGGYGSPGGGQANNNNNNNNSSPWYDAAVQGYHDGEEGDHHGDENYPGLPVLDQSGMEMARTGGATGLSPLANMEPLRTALPDASGTVE